MRYFLIYLSNAMVSVAPHLTIPFHLLYNGVVLRRNSTRTIINHFRPPHALPKNIHQHSENRHLISH